MDPKAWESLINATEQLQSCDSHGTTRGVVTDAYSCIDSCWSALSYIEGNTPSRNHKQKLDAIFPKICSDLASQSVSYDEIESLYRLWLDVRYSQATVTPHEAFRRRMNAHSVFSATLDEVAKQEGISASELEEKLYTALLGDRFQAFEEVVSWLHEKCQQEAEIAGESGYGSKLGNKLANPSNYCELSLISDDEVTREILAKENIVNDEVRALYDAFLKIVLKIDEARHNRGVTPDDVPNFSLGLRVRYTGASVTELGERWGKVLSSALESIAERLKNDNAQQ
jgi:hypothetical protein